MYNLLYLFGGIIIAAIIGGFYLQIVFHVNEKKKLLKAQTELLAMIASRMGIATEDINKATTKAGIEMKD